MLDGTGDPLVHLTTPIYTNVVIGKLKMELKEVKQEERIKLKMLLVWPIYFSRLY